MELIKNFLPEKSFSGRITDAVEFTENEKRFRIRIPGKQVQL